MITETKGQVILKRHGGVEERPPQDHVVEDDHLSRDEQHTDSYTCNRRENVNLRSLQFGSQ